MDVLLALIARHKLDICDIDITSLLGQYLAYLERCREQDLELAGEFLEMAARLIYIKTAALLPHPEEAQKEKLSLQGALIEYALCKEAAAKLRKRFVGDQIFCRQPTKTKVSPAYSRTHPPDILREAMLHLGQNRVPRPKQMLHRLQRVVQRPVVPVLSQVLYVLRKVWGGERVYFDTLYQDVRERSARVALFLAILELTKHGRIGLSPDATYIYHRTDYIAKSKRQRLEKAGGKPQGE